MLVVNKVESSILLVVDVS